MEQPVFTGRAARILGVTEPQLAELVRRGRLNPEPPVAGGRRLWCESHLREAARILGRDLPTDLHLVPESAEAAP